MSREVHDGTDAPPADVHVDAELVRRLVEAQHPDLAGRVELVASGWDNAILRLGSRHAVRMPRRALGAQLAAGEQRWLPELAPRLPVAIPVPVRTGAPAFGYPYPWSIVPWFDGADAASVDRASRAAAAAALAGFVVALGDPAPAEAPENRFPGIPLAERDALTREGLASAALAEAFAPADRADLVAAWDAALRAPAYDGSPVWVHGDLHPANLLLDERAALAAVLDFGDLTSGDSATDLATAWLTFDHVGRAAFRATVDASGRADAATWTRARGWAIALGVAMVSSVGVQGRIGRTGFEALREVLADAALERG
ncbi:aminoglycoside phosphotransferase family protein [Agromyces agglutinans]|nr:aminoglycoside phosphotransferase family protein [Agromyces agglutinans]